jgi:Uma2 family endonuclease
LVGELYSRLKGGPCQSFSSDQRLLVQANGLYTYPDIVIVCGRGEFDEADRDTLVNPTTIIEIISPSTERYDRGAKFRSYQLIKGLKEYVLIAQDEPVCERFVRQPDGSWALVSFVGIEATLVFTTARAELSLADIYAGVEFSDRPSH